MTYLELCADRTDPRRTCKGAGCRCPGAYRRRFESSWRRASPPDVEVVCAGCGLSMLARPAWRDVQVACPLCRRVATLRGRSLVSYVLGAFA